MTTFSGRPPEEDGLRTAVAVFVVVVCSSAFRLFDQLLLLRWPRLFVAAIRIFWVGLLHSPYREGSFARKNAARRAGMSEAELRYGETPVWIARAAMKQVGVTSDSRILDLGAGRGRILIAARTLGAEAVGVELLDEQRLPVEGILKKTGALLIAGDAQTADLEGFSHVWVTWTCMSEDRRRRLADRLARDLAPGTVLLSVSCPPEHDVFEPMGHARVWFTWGLDELFASRVRES